MNSMWRMVSIGMIVILFGGCSGSSHRVVQPNSPSVTAAQVAPSVADIGLEMSRTVESTDRTEHFTAKGNPVTVSDGVGGWLTAILGSRFPTADGYGQLVFFWHNATFVGWDTMMESTQIIRLGTPGVAALLVEYPSYAPLDAACCPSQPPRTIVYRWNGARLAASGLPPGHHANEAPTIMTLP
jgi:LppP/LprE lipoprotein